MIIQSKLKYISISLVIFLIPFLDFLKNNIDEIDIILGKSFYFLIFSLYSILLIISLIINYIFKKKDFYKVLLSVFLTYWILFKHNSLKIIIKSSLKNFDTILTEYNSEISLLFLVTLSIYLSISIFRNNQLFNRFISIFFLLTFFTSIFPIISFMYQSNILKSDKVNYLNYPDKLNKPKENIYFFILDAMQPIKEFEQHYKVDMGDFLNHAKNKNFRYFNNTSNIYDNTTHTMSAFFYLDTIFNDKKEFKESTNILFPTILREENKSDLLNNLINL